MSFAPSSVLFPALHGCRAFCEQTVLPPAELSGDVDGAFSAESQWSVLVQYLDGEAIPMSLLAAAEGVVRESGPLALMMHL
jgi:hypothetical protein